MASHDSAEMALAKYKQVQNEEKHEKNQLKKEIKQAEKGTKAKTVSSSKAVKSAIKEAVIKVSGNKKIGETKVSEVIDKKAHKHSGPLYHAIEGIVAEPYTNGLNAETTAGISMAKQILDASSADLANSMGDFAMSHRKMPPGITASGFLDDEGDE